MPFRPAYPGEVPTLGFDVLEWMVDNLAMPDRTEYEPFVPTQEQAQFVINFYALNPQTGKRKYRRGVISRPKGWGKSPLLSAICAAEALANVVPDGWDSGGRPVGKPWREVRTVYAQMAAVAESQTHNAWDPLLEMLRDAPAMDNYPGLDPMESFVVVPGRGRARIEYITSAASSQEGGRPIFAVLDQTESWVRSNGGVALAATIRRNAAKVGGTTIEAPNAYLPGQGSVSEDSAKYWTKIQEGAVRESGLLYDHREAPPDTELADRDSLLAGLRFAYGDSTWVDLDRLVADIWDPATTPQDARRYYLNQITHATDSWISSVELQAVRDVDKVLLPKDPVVLGFDGSRGRRRGVADATALIGCRVLDGHLFQIAVWEQPDGQDDWLPPTLEVDAEVRSCFEMFKVVGFYADPSGWETQVAAWEAQYGRKLKMKAHQSHPIALWPRGKDSRVVEYVESLQTAIRAGECSYDGAGALTRHMLNARRRPTRSGYLLYKEFPESRNKIDAAYAAVMAWKARNDAIAAGVVKDRESRAGQDRSRSRILVLN